jgi:hypothetical protein
MKHGRVTDAARVRTTQRTPTIERALQGILATVLVLPLAAVQACGSDGSTSDGADAATDGATADVLLPVDGGADAAPPDPCAPIELDAAAYDDASANCVEFTRLPCGLPPAANISYCNLDPETCAAACKSPIVFGCQLANNVACLDDGGLIPDAEAIIDCILCPGAGRRPRGLRAPRGASAHTTRAARSATASTAAPSALGHYFATLAYLEAASVTAFDELGRCLDALGAPPALRREAARAASDERRHARVTRRLARRFGGAPERPRVSRSCTPTLEDLLVENVVEGCVGESYGALVAMWQAERAGDADVADAMRGIAADEARHAALAWSLLRWGAQRLAAPARQRLRRELGAALSRLHVTVEQSAQPATVVSVAGHPPRDVERELVRRFERFARAEAGDLLAAST